MTASKPSIRISISALTTLLLLMLAGPAAASTFAVDRGDDADVFTCSTAASDCTLRGAINAANTTTDADTITIPAMRVSLKADLPFIAQPLTIAGAGARRSIIDGTGSVATVLSGDGMTLEDLEVTGAKAPLANFLAGVAAVDGASLLERVAIVDNQSIGLAVHGATILDSLIARNTGVGSGSIQSDRVDVLRDSTVSDNTALPATDTPLASSGGVFNAAGVIVIEDSTIVRNHIAGGAVSLTGANLGSLSQLTPSVVVRSSIIAGSAGDNCGGAIESQGHNIDSDGSCHFAGAGDRSNVDPLLGPLADNGGPTDTIALLKGSPAIDAGEGCLATDQRGQPRPLGGGCDAGAFESPFTAAIATSTANASPVPTSTTPSATVITQIPPRDRTPPRLSIRGVTRTIARKAIRAGLKIRIAANEPIAADLALLVAPRRVTIAGATDLILATKALSLATGTRTVTLKPGRKLTGTRSIHARLIVIAYDAAGNRAAKTIDFAIR